MSLATITDAIESILGGVSGIGQVYDYMRWASDWKKFLELFQDDNDNINGWMITRTASPERWITIEDYERVHEFKIIGVYGLKDADATELTFQALIEDICTAFRGNDTLNGTCDSITPEFGALAGQAGMQAALVENRMFGSVLCHYCELTLGAQVIETAY